MTSIAHRLKPYAGVLLAFAGGGLAWFMSPLDWFDGYILFFLGMAAGEWNSQHNPRHMRAEGPTIPWDEMYTGDRLSYFFAPLAFAIAGLVALVAAIEGSRVSLQWEMIGSAIAVIGLGIFGAVWKWSRRYS